MTKLLKKCPICGGKVEEKKTDKIINAGRDFVILEVNAGVCEDCNEKIYTKETHEQIQKIREELNNKIPALKQIGHIYAYPVAESV
ncbi:MAG: hypothetical protein BWK75_00435 [Candidatus Altiarchaeales archaeon A3]|nr:MAG: hypothetical protein BWK75_00435 [Candidatus Altiarchaeales archaeon A3]